MACYKRILNELHKILPNKLISLNLNNKFRFVEIDSDIVSKQIGVINMKTDQIELEIVIPSDYPFKPPSVYVYVYNEGLRVSTIKYDKWCGSIIYKSGYYGPIGGGSNCDLFSAWAFCIIRRPELLSYWFSNIPKKDTCLCCESITCGDKWSPRIMMSDILAEYVTKRDFKINSGRLMQRWMDAIFNNDRWVIPDDLILLIVNKL